MLQVCLLAVKMKLLLIRFNKLPHRLINETNIKHQRKLYEASERWGIFVLNTD